MNYFKIILMEIFLSHENSREITFLSCGNLIFLIMYAILKGFTHIYALNLLRFVTRELTIGCYDVSKKIIPWVTIKVIFFLLLGQVTCIGWYDIYFLRNNVMFLSCSFTLLILWSGRSSWFVRHLRKTRKQDPGDIKGVGKERALCYSFFFNKKRDLYLVYTQQ